MPIPDGPPWPADKIRRANDLTDLYNTWPTDGDPDDDPEFVRQANLLMGEPRLLPAVQSAP